MSQFLLAFDKTTVFESFFLKIKSVTQYPNYETFAKEDPSGLKSFNDVFKVRLEKGEKAEDIYQERAVFRSDFSKVAAVCFGFWQMSEETQSAEKQIKAIAKENEADTLRILWQVLDKLYRSNKNKVLVGHNLTIYDIPFYCKRIVKQRENLSIVDSQNAERKIGIPDIIKKMLIAKPWEQTIVDTASIFKFGGVTKPTLDQIAEFIGYKRDEKEIRNEKLNDFYWNSEDKETAMKEIAQVGSSDIEIMMDFMTEIRSL